MTSAFLLTRKPAPARMTRVALSGWSHQGGTTTSGAAAGLELGGAGREPLRGCRWGFALAPAAPSVLATLAAAGVSWRLAGEQVVRRGRLS